MKYFHSRWTLLVLCLVVGLAVFSVSYAVMGLEGQPPPAPQAFRVLATTLTSTMEEELNEAGADGYRFVGIQGGITEFGGEELVSVLQRDPTGQRFRYRLLATSATSTLDRELNELDGSEYTLVGMTLYVREFEGSEVISILEDVLD